MDTRFLLLHLGRSVAADEFLEPFPAVKIHLRNVLLDLWGFQSDTFGDHKTHSSADNVRLDPFQIPVSGDLLLLGRFSVDADRAVSDDQTNIVVFWEILHTLDVVVLLDLLDIPLDLLFTGLVPVDTKQPAHIIADENRKRLGRSSGGTDRSCVVDREILGPVVVSSNGNFSDTLGRRRDHTFCEKGHGSTDRMIEDILAGRLAELLADERVADLECGFLSRHPVFKLPDLCSDPFVAEQSLHSSGKIARDRDLHVRPGVDADAFRLVGNFHRLVKSGNKAVEIRAILRRGYEFCHGSVVIDLKFCER